MTSFVKSFFLFCGIVSALAAFPVFGQENKDGITINKRPFKDFGEFVKQKLDNKEVDLDKPFLVELEGILTKDGEDEKLLLNGANVASKEKQFIIIFAMPKSAAQEMINRRLKDNGVS